MKICAVSPQTDSSTIEIMSFLKNRTEELVVLPGNYDNHPSHKNISKILKEGRYVFVESGSGKYISTPWLVSSKGGTAMPSQIFSVRPCAAQIDELQGNWPKRTFRIKNRKVSFAICGEVDAFQSDGTVKMKRDLPFDILINPTHTARGRWNHLGVKLKNLSKGRVVVHVANNHYCHHDVSSHLRIYSNGKILPRYNTGKISWSVCEV